MSVRIRGTSIARVAGASLLLAACRLCPPKPTATPCAPDTDCTVQSPSAVELVLPVDERPTPFEIAGWLHAGGGLGRRGGGTDAIASLGGGAEGTFRLGSAADCTLDRPCTGWRTRLGPWIGVDSSIDRARGEAGATFSLAGPRAVSWSAFGLRAGVGRGTSGTTHAVAQISWGTRFVPMRRTYVYESVPCRAVIAPTSGLRLFVAARRELDANESFDFTIGLEWQMLGPGLGIVPKFRRGK
jgi:hypothetical protein